MDFKDNGIVALEKGSKKKIKGFKLECPTINRTLIIHDDVDRRDSTTVSDFTTGYRLFSLPIKSSAIKMETITEKLEWFIKHYTVDAIREEFKRIELLLSSQKSGRK